MKLLYSPTEKGFFDRSIHGKNVPADAIEITDAEHAALLAKQTGRGIAMGANARPQALPPSVEQAADDARAKRNRLLAAADAAVNRAVDMGRDAAPYRAWRQALRDVPSQPGFPQQIAWPTPPAS